MRTLNDEQVREILARAEAISQEPAHSQVEISALMAAAEEAGLPKEALQQAIEERFGVAAPPIEPGHRILAKSADGRYYYAEVLEVEKGKALIRFLKGGEHRVLAGDILPGSLLPGQKVTCLWPDWGWGNGTVVFFDEKKQRVKVAGWASEHTFNIRDVRLEPPGENKKAGFGGWFAIYAAGLLSGGVLTWLINWLLTRG